MARLGPIVASGDASAVLLAAPHRRWPTDEFDEINIAVAAPYRPEMMAALRFLGQLRIDRRPHGRLRLSAGNERDVLRWMLGIVGREIGGLRLDRNPGGWCTVTITRRPH